MQSNIFFEKEELISLEDVKEYIEKVIINNIKLTLERNKETNDLNEVFKRKEKLRLLVYKIFYIIVYENLQIIRKQLNYTRFFNLLSKDIKLQQINISEELDVVLGINREVIITKEEMQIVLNTMKNLGIICEVSNIGNLGGKIYYITKPSMNLQIAKTIISIIKKKSNKDVINNRGIKNILGFMLESIIASNLCYYAKLYGLLVEMYRDTQGREIDFILRREGDFENDNICEFYEVKYTDDSKNKMVK